MNRERQDSATYSRPTPAAINVSLLKNPGSFPFCLTSTRVSLPDKRTRLRYRRRLQLDARGPTGGRTPFLLRAAVRRVKLDGSGKRGTDGPVVVRRGRMALCCHVRHSSTSAEDVDVGDTPTSTSIPTLPPEASSRFVLLAASSCRCSILLSTLYCSLRGHDAEMMVRPFRCSGI